MNRTATLGGRYRLHALLAEGGMGEVWRASDELLGREVAVKLLRTSLASDPVVAERFRREARSAASLQHPNMANVFDYVEDDGRPGIVMELVEGPTLAERIAAEAPMEPKRAAVLLGQVLDALGAAHAAGVVHRDVKPPNVIIDAAGTARVTDFGIARALGDSTLTESGTVLGSVGYISPEQLEGAAPVPASDLYAAGVMLYEMLTGRRPFEAETPIAVAMSRLTNDPVPPSRHVAIAPALDAVIMRALQRDPAARFSGATEMRAALDAAANGAEPTMQMPAAELPGADGDATVVLRPQPPSAPAPRRRRIPGRLGVAIVLLLIAATVAGGLATRDTAIRVPKLTGVSLAQATKLAQDAGLKVTVAERRFDSTHPQVDFVLTQNLRMGAAVERGATVALTVSKGPEPCCTVPSLLGMTYAQAHAAVQDASLTLPDRDEAPTAASDADAGTVIAQFPQPGSTLERGDEVQITLSAGRERRKGKGREG